MRKTSVTEPDYRCKEANLPLPTKTELKRVLAEMGLHVTEPEMSSIVFEVRLSKDHHSYIEISTRNHNNGMFKGYALQRHIYDKEGNWYPRGYNGLPVLKIKRSTLMVTIEAMVRDIEFFDMYVL